MKAFIFGPNSRSSENSQRPQPEASVCRDKTFKVKYVTLLILQPSGDSALSKQGLRTTAQRTHLHAQHLTVDLPETTQYEIRTVPILC